MNPSDLTEDKAKASVWITLQGILSVTVGEEPAVTRFPTRQTAALLAYLALHLDQPLPREAICERIWPEVPPTAQRGSLSVALSGLRRILDPNSAGSNPILIGDRQKIQLSRAAVATDVDAFDRAFQRASPLVLGDPARVAALETAASFCQGALLPDFYEDWLLRAREQFAARQAAALLALAEAREVVGADQDAADAAGRAVETDPFSDEANFQWIRLQAQSGRTAAALQTYSRVEALFAAELNAVPPARLSRLAAAIRAGTLPARTLPASEATPLAPSPVPSALPTLRAATATEAPTAAAPSVAPDTRDASDEGVVPLNSPYYVVRPADGPFYEAVHRNDSIVLVKGARQVGKTSLLARGLQRARDSGARVVLTDFQKLNRAQLNSVDELYAALASMIARQAGLPFSAREMLDEDDGPNLRMEQFLLQHILPHFPEPLIWAIDEADRLFTYPFGNEVFGLFRSWHNERVLNPAGEFSRLTIAISYATEAHLFITDLNESPFNVGTRLVLDDFTTDEIAELNARYRNPLRSEDLSRFQSLVGGPPYLIRRGLSEAAKGMPMDRILAEADHVETIFSDHLHRLFLSVSRSPQLIDVLRDFAAHQARPAPDAFYRLRAAGVLAGASWREAAFRCRLYSDYFTRQLSTEI